MATSVVVVDDEELFRRGLCDWLATLPEVKVVGEAENAEACLELVQRVLPDVVLVDIRLPGVSGVTLVQKLKQARPEVRALILSGSAAPDLVLDAFEAGASGFLPKEVSSDELTLALSRVVSGHWYVSPHVTAEVIGSALRMRREIREQEEDSGYVALTNKERDLLKLIAEGNTFTEIARHLSMNSRSVERLKSRLEEKLRAKSISDLVREAIKLGLVEA